jgi:hypothetical protein
VQVNHSALWEQITEILQSATPTEIQSSSKNPLKGDASETHHTATGGDKETRRTLGREERNPGAGF